MNVGVIGLPQTGKTTVFNALTGAHGDVGGYHADVQASVGVVKVPDERLDFLVELFEPKKVRPTTVEFEDIAGIFAHVGQAGEEGGEAFALARDTEALLMVVRCFPDPTVPHILGSVDAGRDLARMNDELLLADLSVIERRVENIQKDIRRAPHAEREHLQDELDLLDKCRVAVEEERGIRSVEMSAAQEKMLRSYAFLTLKATAYLLNVGEEQIGESAQSLGFGGLEPEPVVMCGRLEMEIMELEAAERSPFMEDAGLAQLAAGAVIQRCYETMRVRTFFTYAHDEVGAWTVQAGADGFIRAEVVGFEDLKAAGSMKEAKSQGKTRLEGKDYEVQDGDVITFRFAK
jgi:GTP-binding protein YchF